MASPFTRSSRRSEGLTTRSSTRNNIATAVGSNTEHSGHHHNNSNSISPPQHQQPNIGRKKRHTEEEIDQEEQNVRKKKPRIEVAITSRPKPLPKTRSVVNLKASQNIPIVELVAVPPPLSPPSPPRPQLMPTPPTKKVEFVKKAETPSPSKKVANHHEKVVNGIKHELDRLQPDVADLKKKDEKRKLRSQEDQWFKSEISAYLPEYDSIIGNIPKEEHVLELDTPIIVIDTSKSPVKQPSQLRKSNGVVHEYPLKEFPDTLFTTLHDAQRVDFSFMDKNFKEEGGVDPLSNEYFEIIHRKPERLEKTIRNTDKSRAQHEKDQVMRLLEGLQGHDWLKLMGVSGITESKKKEYEPARDHFIRGCNGLIEKFRWWREEEKRRKLEKEAALAEAEEDEEEEAEEGEVEQEEVEDDAQEVEEEIDDNASDGDPPDYSDIDASAARQLHEEAIARSAPYSKSGKRPRVEAIPELEKDFISFFKKPHLRDAALGKHNRRSGRSVKAWGCDLPEVIEADFDLPSLLDECNDQDYMKMHARRKRRDRRVSKASS